MQQHGWKHKNACILASSQLQFLLKLLFWGRSIQCLASVQTDHLKKRKGNASTSQWSRMALIYFFHYKTSPCQVKSCSKSCSTSPKALENNTRQPHLCSLLWAPAHFHWVEDGERLGSRWQSSPCRGHAGGKSLYSKDVPSSLLMALLASRYRVK